MRSIIFVALSISFTLCGCGVVPPKVSFSTVDLSATGTPPVVTDAVTFRQRRSVIKVDFDPSAGTLTTTSLPYELSASDPGTGSAAAAKYLPLYEIHGSDDFRATTQLKVSYVDNTRFIDQLQITTKDNLADTIGKVGELFKTVAPLLAPLTAGTLSVTEQKFRTTLLDPDWPDIDKWRPDKLNKGYCLRLTDVAIESQISMDKFMEQNSGKWIGAFPVPACATAIVEIARNCASAAANPNPIAMARVTYASSTFVVPTSLPSSGTVKMNSTCGASVTIADKEDRTDLLTYLNSVIKQGKDVYSAWDSAKSKK